VKHALDSIPLLDNIKVFNDLLLGKASPIASPPSLPSAFQDRSELGTEWIVVWIMIDGIKEV
jgi:hypothetical protein